MLFRSPSFAEVNEKIMMMLIYFIMNMKWCINKVISERERKTHKKSDMIRTKLLTVT